MKGKIRTMLIMLALTIAVNSQAIGVYLGPDYFIVGMMNNASQPDLMAKDATSMLFKDDFAIFGYDALNYLEKTPKDVINNFHNYPGKTLEDPQIKQFIKDHFIQNDFAPQSNSSIAFKVNYLKQGETFSIEEIYALLFNHIKETSEYYYKTTITSAFVTIPSFFTYKEKEALRQGIELSNLALNGFITENLASAVDYQLNTTFPASGSLMLMLSIGSWYTQASIYDFSTLPEDNINEIKTKSEVWDKNMGESQFNRKIALFLYEKYGRKVPLNRAVYVKFYHQVWKCKELLKGKEEVSLSISEIEDKPVAMIVKRTEIEPIVNSFIADAVKLVAKAVSNSQIEPNDVKTVEYYGSIFKYPYVKEKLDENVKAILSKAVINIHKSKSAARGVTFLSKPSQMIKFTIGSNSEITLHFTNKYLHSKHKLCPIVETKGAIIRSFNSTCIHDLNDNFTLIHLRQGYELQRSISFYHDSDFEIKMAERMEGDEEKDESIVKTYRIADIPLLLEEMESYSIKTIPKISLLFYYNRVGQFSLKAEGNYNLTLYMGKSIGPGGSEEVIYSPDYSAPLTDEEKRAIDKKIEAATSEDEKMMLQFKKKIGETKEELIQYPLSIIAEYPNPKPLLTSNFGESKAKLGKFNQVVKSALVEKLKEVESLLKQIDELIGEASESRKKLSKDDLTTFTNFASKIRKWYEEDSKKASMNIVRSKLGSSKFALKMIKDAIIKSETKPKDNEDL